MLSGDIITSLFINYEWRRLLSDALQSYSDSLIARLDDSLVDDFRNQFQALLDDLYSEDVVPANAKSFTVERTTTSFSLASGAWQPIPVVDGKNPDGLADFSSSFIKITEAGLYSVKLILSVRNAATAANVKLCSLRNRTQNTRPCIGVSTNVGGSAIVRHWDAIDDIFECDAGDEFEFELFSASSATTVESDGTIGSQASRCLQAVFTQLASG